MAAALLLSTVYLAPSQPGLTACRTGYDHFPFCDPSKPLDDRVNDLISRINNATKPALLTARENTAIPELGVPAYYWGHNCIHSSMFDRCTSEGRCSTSFPSGPNWAATFDYELMRKMAVVIGEETRGGFNLKTWKDNGGEGAGLECWGPVININRDPRWGRNGEGGTECPYLMGEVGKAWTNGVQNGNGTDPETILVAVTLKHFDANDVEGHNPTENGLTRHTVNANLSNYLLADYYWPAFKKSIRDAGAKGVMCSYNEVNGIPTCLSPLMKAAREAWNFSGYVTSDSDSIADAWSAHHYVSDASEASCLALSRGGCDIDSGGTFMAGIPKGLESKNCTIADVDRALFNTMKLRFELGLFDAKKKSPYWKLGEEVIGTDASRALNLEAASKGIVLIKNSKNLLPLKKGMNYAVIGPHGNATENLIQIDTGAICPDGIIPGSHRPTFTVPCVVTPYNAIKAANVGGTTTYTSGSDLFDPSTDGFAAAVEAAKGADAIILGLGISERKSTAGDMYVEYETHDRTSIDLPEVQKGLLSALLATNKPIVIFYLNAGSVGIPADALNAENAAIIEAFYPGMQGGTAIAEQIFGISNRWGKMPYTIYPPEWANETSMLDHDVTHNRTYRYGAKALVPFGAGLSLTTFELSFDGSVSKQSLKTDGSDTNIDITVNVKNTGSLNGDEVVQAYFHPLSVNLPLFPIKSLFGIQRVDDITSGSTGSAKFSFNVKDLLISATSGDLVAAPGSYKITFENGAGEVLSVDLDLLGSQVVHEPFPSV